MWRRRQGAEQICSRAERSILHGHAVIMSRLVPSFWADVSAIPFFFLAKSAALGIKGTENDIEFCRTIRSLDKNGCGDEMNRCHLNAKNLP